MKKSPRTKTRQLARTVSIVGTGSYVPERIVTNADLEKVVETTDEWITSRTGIQQRRIAAEGEFTSHMAAKAAMRALEQAECTPEEVDLILVATVTPDTFFPSTACHGSAADRRKKRRLLRHLSRLLRLPLRHRSRPAIHQQSHL